MAKARTCDVCLSPIEGKRVKLSVSFIRLDETGIYAGIANPGFGIDVHERCIDDGRQVLATKLLASGGFV